MSSRLTTSVIMSVHGQWRANRRCHDVAGLGCGQRTYKIRIPAGIREARSCGSANSEALASTAVRQGTLAGLLGSLHQQSRYREELPQPCGDFQRNPRTGGTVSNLTFHPAANVVRQRCPPSKKSRSKVLSA
ncbi:hypothetical protein [Streptomyces sp. NPDC018000]|uniref:hypothetical protein n=1 Tax=Streptomyces sp. NPDC018000 TaxID=3365028 RepID=UPI0037B9A9A2